MTEQKPDSIGAQRVRESFNQVMEQKQKQGSLGDDQYHGDNEAIAAARAVLHGAKLRPSHVMCIGWPTIKRLMQGEAVWFEDLQCGAVAAEDLLNVQQSIYAMELMIAEMKRALYCR